MRTVFQSTPSGRKATLSDESSSDQADVSIHAFREEGDALPVGIPPDGDSFNPRLPGGRRPPTPVVTPTPGPVSIHAFREEGDWAAPVLERPSLQVSIHAFREEGDVDLLWQMWVGIAFQSTPSGRKATGGDASAPPPARVSIHAFREEGDCRQQQDDYEGHAVSIHAFREEGDKQGLLKGGYAKRFNPRLPGGRRLMWERQRMPRKKFQSTPSGRKATGHPYGQHSA